MKRQLLTICMLFHLITFGVNAQSEVDLNKMVKSQIEVAQKKAEKDQIKKERLEKLKQAQEGYSTGVISIYTFLTVSLLIVGGVALRRMIIKQNNHKKRIVKQGILMMRQERIISLENPKKSYIRQKLGRSQYSVHAKGGDITKLAKLLDISQGEVLLAKKINARQYSPYRTTTTDDVDLKKRQIQKYTSEQNDDFGKHLKEYLLQKENIDTEKLIYLN